MRDLSLTPGFRIAGPVVAAVLAMVLFAKAFEAFPYQFGIDFYQFWGVPVAHRSMVPASPYADPSGYARALNGLADASRNAKLRYANSQRRVLETMATPFFYSVFSYASEDYESAQIFHTALLYLAAGASVFLLARLRGISPWPSAWISLFVLITFNPFVQDVKYGNVSSLQLLCIAVLLRIAVSGRYPRGAFAESLYLGSLAVFAVFKPNTLWIVLAFAAHYATARGARRFALGSAAAVAGGLLALACGAWFFHDAGVWVDWYRFTQGMNGGSLVRTLEQGNLSPAMLLAQRSMHYGLVQYSLMIAAWLGLALVLAMTSMGRRTDLLVPTARSCLSDPWLAVSIGIVFTIATSPLVWAYYHLFALIPMFALTRPGGRQRLKRACVAACYVAMMNPLLEFLGSRGLVTAIHFVMLWSWLPLLVALLADVADRRGIVEASLAAPAVR
ncbi:MAG: hypothetical protein ACXWG6_06820 [Usitatibacter sp.]